MQMAVAFDGPETVPVKATGRFDLHSDASAIERIEHAQRHAPLRAFLANVNANESIFSTIGCRVWSTIEDTAAEPHVFASRIDLIFLKEDTNFGPGPHENVATGLIELLSAEAAEALRMELRISPAEFAGDDAGFCLRVILYGRGATPEQAQMRWGLGLARLQQALLFVGRAMRHHAEPASTTKPA